MKANSKISTIGLLLCGMVGGLFIVGIIGAGGLLFLIRSSATSYSGEQGQPTTKAYARGYSEGKAWVRVNDVPAMRKEYFRAITFKNAIPRHDEGTYLSEVPAAQEYARGFTDAVYGRDEVVTPAPAPISSAPVEQEPATPEDTDP